MKGSRIDEAFYVICEAAELSLVLVASVSTAIGQLVRGSWTSLRLTKMPGYALAEP